MISPTPYVPNTDISRVHWGHFGIHMQSMFNWVLNVWEYCTKLLFSVPIGQGTVTYGSVLVFFLLIFTVVKFFMNLNGLTLGADSLKAARRVQARNSRNNNKGGENNNG